MRATRSSKPRVSLDAKISAYNDAIDALNAHFSESDTEDDIRARKWLADKLDKECDRMVKRRTK